MLMLRYRGSVHWEGVFIWGVISSIIYRHQVDEALKYVVNVRSHRCGID